MTIWDQIVDNHGSDLDLKYDLGLPLCFVGLSSFNRIYYDLLSTTRQSTIISLEDLEKQPSEFFKNNQFICLTSDVFWKKKLVSLVQSKGGHFFSIVGRSNIMDSTVTIGHGTLVINYNFFFDHTSIGDHCMVMSCTQLVHRAVIKDYCHISGYCHVSCATIGEGCVLGLRSSVVGKPKELIAVADHCNMLIGSTVTRSIVEPGTYFGNRKSKKESSLELRIL